MAPMQPLALAESEIDDVVAFLANAHKRAVPRAGCQGEWQRLAKLTFATIEWAHRPRLQRSDDRAGVPLPLARESSIVRAAFEAFLHLESIC